MFGLLGVVFFLGLSTATSPYDAAHQSSEFDVVKDIGSGLLDEGLRAVEYVDQFLENVNSPAFKKIVRLYEENEHRLESCRGAPSLTSDLRSANACFCITYDVANISQAVLVLSHDLYYFIVDFINDLKEVDGCKNVAFFQKLSCYLDAFKDMQALLAKYMARINQLLLNVTDLFSQFKIDIHNCFSHTNTTQFSERFEKNIALCKLILL